MMHHERLRLRFYCREIDFFVPIEGRVREMATASNPNDRLMFRRVLEGSTSNPSTAFVIQATSTFLLSVSSSLRNAGFRNTFFVEELDRSSRSVSRL